MFDHAYSNYMVSKIPGFFFSELLLLTWERKRPTVHDVLEKQQEVGAKTKLK